MAIVPFSNVEVPDVWSSLPHIGVALERPTRPQDEWLLCHPTTGEKATLPTPTVEWQLVWDDGFAAVHDMDQNTILAEEVFRRPTHALANGTVAVSYKTKKGTWITKNLAELKSDHRVANLTINVGSCNHEMVLEVGVVEGYHFRPDGSKRKVDVQIDDGFMKQVEKWQLFRAFKPSEKAILMAILTLGAALGLQGCGLTATTTATTTGQTSEVCPSISVQEEFFSVEMAKFILVMMLFTLVLGMYIGFRAGAHCHTPPPPPVQRSVCLQSDVIAQRNVALQSQCTYKWKYAQPRFYPLPENAHGVYLG
jgi:hypothetical protein